MSRFAWGDEPLSATASGVGVIIDSPGVKQRIWITDVVIDCGSDTTVSLEDEDGTVLFPYVQQAALSLNAPIVVDENKAVSVVREGSARSNVFLGYYIEPSSHV